MKLIIQIPCYNEEETLAIALAALPREVPGVDEVEWLIINDGSQDDTIGVAKANGVDHIVDLGRNRGLAVGFMAGLDACLARGADIIVNTDADNQYNADDIPALIAPILAGKAEIVVGARPIEETEHFSPVKKLLQGFGSYIVRRFSRAPVRDAPSGFRAMSRDAAMRLNVFNEFTYTLETIIQAGQRGMSIMSVPVRTNPDLRPSRLFKSIPDYVRRSVLTIFRIFVVYRPFRFFMMLGLVPFAIAFVIGLRWAWWTYIMPDGRDHLPSLILTAILFILAFQTWFLAFVADLLGINRRLLEDLQYTERRKRYNRDIDQA